MSNAVVTLLSSIRAAYGKDQANAAQVVGIVAAAVMYAKNAGAANTLETVRAEALAGRKSKGAPARFTARALTLAAVEHIRATAPDAGARPDAGDTATRSAAADAYGASVAEWCDAYRAGKPAPVKAAVTAESLQAKIDAAVAKVEAARAELAEFIAAQDAIAAEVAALEKIVAADKKAEKAAAKALRDASKAEQPEALAA